MLTSARQGAAPWAQGSQSMAGQDRALKPQGAEPLWRGAEDPCTLQPKVAGSAWLCCRGRGRAGGLGLHPRAGRKRSQRLQHGRGRQPRPQAAQGRLLQLALGSMGAGEAIALVSVCPAPLCSATRTGQHNPCQSPPFPCPSCSTSESPEPPSSWYPILVQTRDAPARLRPGSGEGPGCISTDGSRRRQARGWG